MVVIRTWFHPLGEERQTLLNKEATSFTWLPRDAKLEARQAFFLNLCVDLLRFKYTESVVIFFP